MNNKPRLVMSLFLTLAVLISPIYAAETQEQTDISAYTERIERLCGLGIANIDTESFEPDKTLTRAEFARMAGGFFDTESVIYGGTVFSDVSDDEKGILTLASLGIISGYGDGSFGSDDELSVENALKIAMSMLGYDEYVKVLGGGSTEYLFQAKRIGLTSGMGGLNIYSSMTWGDAVILLDNIIDTDVLEAKVFSSKLNYTAVKGETLLAIYRDIYSARGIMCANEFTSLNSENGTGEGWVKIGSSVYSTESSVDGFLGYELDAWYRETDGIKTLVFAQPTSRNKTLTVKAKDITDFSRGTLTYFDKEQRSEQRLSFEGNVIVNGVYQSSYADSDFRPEKGSVSFIDTNSDGEYETIIITRITTAVAGSIAAKDEIIYDKYSKAKVYESDDKDRRTVRDNYGTKKEFADIKEGDVLEFIISRKTDKRRVEITICTDIVTSAVTSLNKSGSDASAVLGTDEYALSEYMKNCIKNNYFAEPSPGDTYAFHFSSDGEIVYFAADKNTELRYAYIMEIGAEKDSFNQEPVILLLDQGGEQLTLSVADSFRLDSVSMKKQKAVLSDMRDAMLGEVVKYKMNIRGEITLIDTKNGDPAVEAADSIKRLNSVEGTFRKLKTGSTINGKLMIANNPIVFAIPSSRSRAYGIREYYRVVSISNAVSSHPYNVTGYNGTGSEMFADVILVKNDDQNIAAKDFDNHPMYVNAVSSTRDSEGNTCLEIEGFLKGAKQTIVGYDYYDGTRTINPGDILDVRASVNGKYEFGGPGISKFYIDYENGRTPEFLYTGIGGYTQSYLFRWMAVNKNEDGYLRLSALDAVDDSATFEYFDTADAAIYIYDSKNEKFSEGSVGDIVSYETNPSEYSRAFVAATSGQAYIAVYTY